MSWLKVKTVEVVQQVDVEELEKTIKWLVETVQAQPSGVGGAAAAAATAAVGPLQDEIDALRRENRDLKSLMQQLQAKQNDIEERLDTKPQPDQAAKADDGATAAAAASDSATTANDAAAAPSSPSGPDLERRVAALEEQLTAQQAASASQPPRDVSTSPPAGTREATEDGPQAAAAPGLDLGSQLQELVAGHSALAATVAGLQKELEAKPSRGELDLKANRSELDAMLRAGAAPVAAEGEAAAPALAVAEDGSVDSGALADAVNKAGAELAALRGQVAVLMERLGGKADQGSVDDLAGQLAALKARGTSGAAAAPAAAQSSAASSATPTVDSAALDGLIRRIEEVEVKLAAAGSTAPAAATGEEDTAAVEAIDTLADVQPLLKDIYARLDAKADRSGLEDALRKLQELASLLAGKADTSAIDQLAARVAAAQQAAGTAAAAAARRPSSGAAAGAAAAARAASPPSNAQQQQEQPFMISHELPTADLEAAINDLRSQLAALKAQVLALGSAANQRAAATPLAAAAATADANAKRLSAVVGDGADGAALGAVERLQAQLGELLTRVAGKADASELTRLELLVNGKADVDEVAELRGALGAKADGAALDELQLAVAGKAEQSALDEVKLMATLGAGAAAGAGDGTGAEGGEGGGSGGGGGYTNLLGAIQGMVGDKATKAELLVLQGQLAGKATAEEVAALREALDGKAGAAELGALAGQVLGHAGQEALASLDQRMGDVYAELDKIRADLAALPAEVLAGGAGAGRGAAGTEDVSGDAAAGLQRMVSQLSREVGSLREGLDTVSHAANVLAVGLDNARASRSHSGMGMGAVDGQYGDAGGAGGKENRSPRGGYERLVKLLGSGDFRHKMDFFDPAALQQMAQKLASLEATLKSPAMARIGAGGNVNGTDHGLKDLERQLKRLAIDVRVMKDKMIDPSAPGPRMAPGDHAMLAARPIQGYRCMACDRPLDTLDTLPGPHIPTAQLPVRGSPVDPSGRVQARSGRQGADQLSPQPSADKLKPNHDPNVRGVQNWYTDTKGLAAEALPREHVGPHLPPGGWRPSNPGTLAKLPVAQGNLPNIGAPKSSRSTPVPDISGYSTPQQQPSPMDGAANVTLPQLS